MRHSDVNNVDVGVCQQRPVIRLKVTHGGHLTKPVERGRVGVAHAGQFDPHREIHEGKPASQGAGHFSTH